MAVCLAVALAISTAGVVAGTPPTPPHQIYGTVNDQDGDAMEGVTVKVVYDGAVVKEAVTDSNGYYEVKVPDPNDEKTGEKLSFIVVDESTSKQLTWESAESSRVDFTVSTGGDSPGGTTTTTATTTSDDGDSPGSNPSSPGGNAGSPGGSSSSLGSDDTTTTTSTSTTEFAIEDPTETTTTTITTTDDSTEPTTEENTPSTEITTDDTTTKEGGDGLIPGFDISIALLALVAGGFLALRRSD